MDIITTSSTQEMIRQNKCQMRFLDMLVLKQYVDNQLMIVAINCSVFNFPSTFYDDEMENCVSKSTVLEPTIKS